MPVEMSHRMVVSDVDRGTESNLRRMRTAGRGCPGPCLGHLSWP